MPKAGEKRQFTKQEITEIHKQDVAKLRREAGLPAKPSRSRPPQTMRMVERVIGEKVVKEVRKQLKPLQRDLGVEKVVKSVAKAVKPVQRKPFSGTGARRR